MTSFEGPSSTTRPRSRSRLRVQRVETARRLWDTKMTVAPPGMISAAYLDQRRTPTVHLKGAPSGPHDAAQELQDRALAGTVRADDAEGLAPTHTDRHVLESPEFPCGEAFGSPPPQHSSGQGGNEIPQRIVQLSLAELLVDAVEAH